MVILLQYFLEFFMSAAWIWDQLELISHVQCNNFYYCLVQSWFYVNSYLSTLLQKSVSVSVNKPVSYTHLDVYKRQGFIDLFNGLKLIKYFMQKTRAKMYIYKKL